MSQPTEKTPSKLELAVMQLSLLCRNLEQGMSKSIQKLVARSTREVLAELSKPEVIMNNYTVLLLRPDYIVSGCDPSTFMAHVTAEDVDRAKALAQQEAWESDQIPDSDTDDFEGCGDPNDYHVLLVADGHLKDLNWSVT